MYTPAPDAITAIQPVRPAPRLVRPPTLEQRVMAAVRRLGAATEHHYPLATFAGSRVAYPHASWVPADGRRRHLYGTPTTCLDAAAGELLWRLEDAAGVGAVRPVTSWEGLAAARRHVRAVIGGRWTPASEIASRAAALRGAP